jgi:hypothetical protein
MMRLLRFFRRIVNKMDRNAGLKEMALRYYGYGRWDAPYWFIGIGEGMGKESLELRLEAWLALGRETGLSDCREFHKYIGDENLTRKSPKLQKTWRPLILLLLTALGRDADAESLRAYQSENWGMQSGDTCVCELFGLPAPTFKAYNKLAGELFTQHEIDDFLQKRIDFLRGKIEEHHPKLVVMYGATASGQWNQIADHILERSKVYRIGPTLMVSTIHPVARNPKGNAYWTEIGETVRRKWLANKPNPAQHLQ